uniref:Speckle-type POZ protein (inferred by orthology to a human protein) n=1 Tax=Strongyloides papillosus TaxID=174720 RepID=A0A0N5BT32_STREA
MKWHVFMYPVEVNNIHEDCISIKLYLKDVNWIELTAIYSFYILSVDGKKKHSNVSGIKRFNKGNTICFIEEFLKQDLLRDSDNELLPNGNLILGCEIFYYFGAINTVELLTNNNTNESLHLLSDDIAGLLESSKFSGCVIKVGNSKINVHKCILASRSQVFDSILTRKQCESNPYIIEIDCFRFDVVYEMIYYLYTGKSPNMDEMACKMLEIGEICKLKQLKLMAEESLIHSLSIENACNYLVCSELYSSEILKDWCLRFIYLNAENIVNKEEWKKVVSDYPLLIAKIFNIAVNID